MQTATPRLSFKLGLLLLRDWMNGSSWVVSEAVIALFIGLQINTLVSS